MSSRAIAVIALFLIVGPPARAQEKSKCPAQEVKVNLSQGAFAIEMVRLPDAKTTARDKDGKEITQTIKGIWIGKYEVRYRQYNPFWQLLDLPQREASPKFDAKSRPSKPYTLPHHVSDDYAAYGIALLAAQKYCEWLSAQTGKKFRLPTEAEWEYACRAGEKQVDEKALGRVAWHAKNAEDAPHDPGQLAPNAWGIHDMLGNLAEWVSAGGQHVVKGGSYQDDPRDLTPTAREPYSPAWQSRDPKDPRSKWWLSDGPVGFRVVMEE